MTYKKTLRPGEIRFVVKETKTGRNTTYNVYDRASASLPVTTNELGRVPQAHTDQASAQEVVDRLNKEHPS